MPIPDTESKSQQMSRSHWFFKPVILSLVVFLLTITLSIIAWFNTKQRIEKDARTYFENEAMGAKEEVQTRIQHYIDTLYSVQGLFNARIAS